MDFLQRFHSKIELNTNGCHNWIGAKNTFGYGEFMLTAGTKKSHRISFMLHKGKITEGLVIDHLCKNTSCVNPEHLEAVTQKENIRRGNSDYNKHKTHCPQGHEYNKENTYFYKYGRSCKPCKIQNNREYRKNAKNS